VINADNGLAIVMIGSSKAQVIEIESTPDSGVEIRKAAVAPLLAPCSLSEAAAGSTPHDQSGIGIPKRAAFMTEINLPLPRCFATYEGERNIFSRPPIMRPNRIYMEDSSSSAQDSFRIVVINGKSVSMFSLYAGFFNRNSPSIL
jgi:hypothetical protein